MKFDKRELRLPGVEPGSIAWKAIILTVGLQTLVGCRTLMILFITIPTVSNNGNFLFFIIIFFLINTFFSLFITFSEINFIIAVIATKLDVTPPRWRYFA
jgi:hypothetical protein